MNRIEKLIYDILKSNPKLKLLVRNIYQKIFDLMPRKKDCSINPIYCKEEYFFGFHDVSPFSYDGSKVLANKLTIPLKMPESSDILEVGYFPFNNEFGNFVKFGETRAWNYHKGCRLQWVDKKSVIYNDINYNNQLCSVLLNIDTGRKIEINYPIDSVSKCGKYATSFSYQRLEKLMPGYGYNVEDNSFLDENLPSQTGLFLVDLSSNKRNLICSLEQLSKIGNLSKEDLNSRHYVTHSLFSYDGRYISFLHRWIKNDLHKRWSRLVVFDREYNKFYLAPTNEMVSHYVWNQINEIIAYCRIGNIDSHVLFETPTLEKFKRVAYPQLNSDGHQCFVSDNEFITDTYPDKFRMSNLYLVNIAKNEVRNLASLNSSKKYQSKFYKHWGCDLHPRTNGEYVCFDSTHTGERALCIMKL